MKHANDNKTADLLGDTCDLAGPVPPKPTAQSKAAARALKYREKNGVRPMTVNLPAELHAAFDAWCTAKGKTKNAVIAELIETQLLRKR